MVAIFCMAPPLREERVVRSGPPFAHQCHGMTLNIFLIHHLINYHFSALEPQTKLKVKLHVHVALKSVHQTYESVHFRRFCKCLEQRIILLTA